MLETGSVVMAKAGRDKNRFFCVVESSQDRVKLADGKSRRLEHPKQKNVKHIQATTTRLDLNARSTNRQLRTLLRPFNEGARKNRSQP